VLIVTTGAAGLVGSLVRPMLRRPGRVLGLTDIAAIEDLADSEEFVQASVTDLDAMTSAFDGADVVGGVGQRPELVLARSREGDRIPHARRRGEPLERRHRRTGGS
jgi:hypothetical protein